MGKERILEGEIEPPEPEIEVTPEMVRAGRLPSQNIVTTTKVGRMRSFAFFWL